MPNSYFYDSEDLPSWFSRSSEAIYVDEHIVEGLRDIAANPDEDDRGLAGPVVSSPGGYSRAAQCRSSSTTPS